MLTSEKNENTGVQVGADSLAKAKESKVNAERELVKEKDNDKQMKGKRV